MKIKREHNTRYQEIRDIPGYEGRYAATKNGKIYSHIQHKFLKEYDNYYNYLVVNLTDANRKVKHMRVHRAVLMAFNPVEGMEHLDANHLDEDTRNNKLSNLCWMTRKENINYGTRNKRVGKANSKKIYCQELDRVFNSQTEAAEELDLLQAGISQCCYGKQKTCGGYHFCFWNGKDED